MIKGKKDSEKELIFSSIEKYFPFVKFFSEEEKKVFNSNLLIKDFKKGERIHQGENGCTGVISLVKGRTRTFIFSAKGKEITLFRLLPEDHCILSASCMMNNIVFDIHVSAEENCRILIIPPEYFEQLAREYPPVERFRNDIIAMRFSEVMWLIEQVMFKRMDQRVATFLSEMANITGEESILLSHQEIADNLGTAREVISRILKYLETEGYIEVLRKEIKILKPSLLEKLALK